MIKPILLCLLSLSALAPAETILLPFRSLPDYSFDSWENRLSVDPEGLRLTAKDSRGGFGYTGKRDLSAFKDQIPHLKLNFETKGDLRRLEVRIFDADRTRARFRFRVQNTKTGESVLVQEEAALALGDPAAIDQRGDDGVLDLSRITNIQIIGDWRPEAIALCFEQLLLVPAEGAKQE